MAISNRRGYEETDERYVALINALKTLVRFVIQRKGEVQRARRQDDERRKSNEIKISFARKTRTMEILRTRLEKEEQEEVEDEHLQFMRAAKLAQNTRKIMISHNAENKEYGRFLMRIFDNLGLDVENTIIFTSDTKTGVPHGVNEVDPVSWTELRRS